MRSVGRSSKPLTPSGSSVRPHILSSNILQKSVVTRRAWSRFLASESFHTSGQKVGVCRWFQVFVSLRSFFDDWTSLLVVLIRANLDEPWMCASVLDRNTVKSVELEGGMPGVGEKRADELQRDGRN